MCKMASINHFLVTSYFLAQEDDLAQTNMQFQIYGFTNDKSSVSVTHYWHSRHHKPSRMKVVERFF